MDAPAADRTLANSAEGQWRDALITRMFKLMHAHEADNFDAVRYRGENPGAFYFERHASYFSFFLRNAGSFHAARQLLQDEYSRDYFDQLLLFRMLGHLHVRLPFNTPENRALAAKPLEWKAYDTDDIGPYGPLALFTVPTDGADIAVKCWKENVEATFLVRPYYFARDGVRIAPEVGDHVIDAGACFGDTALKFAHSVGDEGHVYTFDPLPRHFSIMQENFAMNPALTKRITAFDVGLANEDHDGGGRQEVDDVINPGATVFGWDVTTRRIDDLAARGAVPRVDFIKMDIEGSELPALQGAEQVIRRWRPKLAISLYHRPNDFFTIPLWVDSLDCGYRFFLDHYSIHNEETVLYAQATS